MAKQLSKYFTNLTQFKPLQRSLHYKFSNMALQEGLCADKHPPSHLVTPVSTSLFSNEDFLGNLVDLIKHSNPHLLMVTPDHSKIRTVNISNIKLLLKMFRCAVSVTEHWINGIRFSCSFIFRAKHGVVCNIIVYGGPDCIAFKHVLYHINNSIAVIGAQNAAFRIRFTADISSEFIATRMEKMGFQQIMCSELIVVKQESCA